MNVPGRRGKLIWLALIGVIVAALSLASISGTAAISPVVALGMVLAYIAVVALTMTNIDLTRIGRSVATQGAAVRMTTAARKATSRARNIADYDLGSDEVLVDVGFLVNERRRDGRWDRRIAESASFDDGAIQPYFKLHVPPHQADRTASVEFEFYDRSGRLQFRHQMEEYLRQGENLVLSDRQLALRDNPELGRAGTWDLRIKVDGILVGVHDFNMASSAEERRQHYERERERELERPRPRGRPVLDTDEVPVSLEELLREQARRSGDSGQ